MSEGQKAAEYKQRSFVFVFFILGLLIARLSAQDITFSEVNQRQSKFYNKILTPNDIKSIDALILADEALQIERRFAYLFHKILNQYRISKKLHALEWDDHLWAIARNHSLYMVANKLDATHFQYEDKKFYVAFDHMGRYKKYSTTTNSILLGENVYTSDIAYIRTSSTQYPEESFDAWKASPDHNSNMLDKQWKSHGTAYYIDFKNNYFAATSVFSNQKSKTKTIAITWSQSEKARYASYKHKNAK
jgi:hypothetical protein